MSSENDSTLHIRHAKVTLFQSVEEGISYRYTFLRRCHIIVMPLVCYMIMRKHGIVMYPGCHIITRKRYIIMSPCCHIIMPTYKGKYDSITSTCTNVTYFLSSISMTTIILKLHFRHGELIKHQLRKTEVLL